MLKLRDDDDLIYIESWCSIFRVWYLRSFNLTFYFLS